MSNPSHSPIRGFLIDLDGVIYIDDDVISGAAESIQYLKENHIPCRFLTNTTILSRGNLYKKIQRLRLPIEKDEIISPPTAAARYLRRQKDPRCHLVIMEETREDFAEFRETDDHPDYVVIGKIGDRWNYALMNQLFSMLMGGASLIALHKDRCTMKKNGLQIEFGAFVAGLEYASGKPAYVVGKPSPAFFQSALEDIGLAPEEVVMIGDDMISDISGAQNAGMRGYLVQTGKYKEDWARTTSIQPNHIIPSIAEIPNLLEA